MLVILFFWTFDPVAAGAGVGVAGLTQRVLSVEVHAWFVAMGWLSAVKRSHRRPRSTHLRYNALPCWRIRSGRLKKGWSALHLSKRAGVPGWVIHRIEEGESPPYLPSEGNTALLAEVLDMPVGSMLTERDRLVERLPHRGGEGARRSER